MTSELSLIAPPLENYSRMRLRFERLATYVNSPDAKEKLVEESKSHPARALVIRAILATPGLPGFLYEQVGAPGYRRAGFDILGIGFHAVTVNDGDTSVRKYYRRTAGESEQHQQATIDAWNAKQALVMQDLAHYAVPQLFTIEENPLNPSQSIVSASQLRITVGGSVDVFHHDPTQDTVNAFMDNSRGMLMNNDGLAAPDIIGKDNVLIEAETGNIKLIDTIALARNDPNDTYAYDRVVSLLDTRAD